MNTTLNLQEFAIALSVKNHNSAILNLDSLRYSNIVPDDWELAHFPIDSNLGSQIIFQNGDSIVVQPEKVIFLEAVNFDSSEDVRISEVACKYIKTLSNLDFQAIGINLRDFVTVNNQDFTPIIWVSL